MAKPNYAASIGMTDKEISAAESMGMTPEQFKAAFPDPADRAKAAGEGSAGAAASDKAQVEFNVAQMKRGMAYTDHGWVPVSSLPAQEQKNISTLSEPVPKGSIPGDPGAPKLTLEQANDAAINQMYQGILGEFQTAANAVTPYISGQMMPAETANAQALANRYAGGGVQGPDASIQGVLNKDFQAEAAANTAGQMGVASAIKGVQAANVAGANVAPYSQLLNALASHAQTQIVYGNAQPDVTKSPGYVQEALAAANQLQSQGAAGATTPAPAAAPSPVTTSGSGFSATTG